MKIFRHIIVFGFLICFSVGFSQTEDATSKIKVVGRYVDQGIELRFFPDKKQTLDIGLQNGFIIERASGKSSSFSEIGTTKPLSAAEWEALIASKSNIEEQEDIEMAYDFLQDIGTSQNEGVSFDEGISKLKEEKAKEDFQFMVFVLTAIKNEEVATGLGLGYIDTTAQQGQEYTYRVRLAGKSNIYSVESIPETIVARKNAVDYSNKVYTKVGDTQLSFLWVENSKLSGYYVERQDARGNFIRLNDTPIYTLTGKEYTGERRSGFNEDSLTNYKTYTYRFLGQNAFGELQQFAEVKAMPKDLTPPQQPFLKQPKHTKPDVVEVNWDMTKDLAPDFKGFAVSRGESNKGEFQILHQGILPKTVRKFEDYSFVKGKTNYYLVQAIDTANNVSSSFPIAVTLIDSVPPKKPAFISGKMDSLGIVTLKVKPNTETDLMGYRLFRANSNEHEFSAIQEDFLELDSLQQKLKESYRDTVTLKSLTPYVYYKVKALDNNFNQSEFSDVLKVKRLDTIPPTAPVFKNVSVKPKEVKLEFALSGSKDVSTHELYRKIDLKSPWVVLTTIENSARTYIDKDVEQGTKYFYSLRAKDDGGLYSEYALPVYGKPYDNGVREPVKNLKITNEDGKARLTWDYDDVKDVLFVIYKHNANGQLVQHTNSKTRNFEESASKGATYAVKVFTTDGGQSKVSETVSLR